MLINANKKLHGSAVNVAKIVQEIFSIPRKRLSTVGLFRERNLKKLFHVRYILYEVKEFGLKNS